jgi:hypothetical protein
MSALRVNCVWQKFVFATVAIGWCSLGLASERHLASEVESSSGSAEARDLAEYHQQLRERTTQTFAQVAYLSPSHTKIAGRGVWMAPLLLQELGPADGETPRFPRFGALTVSESKDYRVDETRLTVYTTARRIPIDGRLYRQDTYLWFYPPTEAGQPLRYRGFRQTLARNRFPAVRELISNEATARVFFVSKSVERAAAKQFGPPLPGRRFSVEPDGSKHRNVIVARILNDGAQPMGPFVYLEHKSLAMPNLKCRCEPSQVGEFTLNQRYQLVPVPSFEELMTDSKPGQSSPMPANAGHLSGVLRLPKSM